MKKLVLLMALLPAAALAQAPVGNPPPKPDLTEIWSPVPPKVEPGKMLGQPPSRRTTMRCGIGICGC